MLNDPKRRKFDVVMAWSIDRIGRSLIDLLHTIQELKACGVDLFLEQQSIDTTTPSGKLMFQVCGAFAEFERSMIRQRVKLGLKHAIAEGKRLGRPARRDTPKLAAQIYKLRAAKPPVGIIAISKKLGCGVSLVQRVLSEAR
jgi:DNA invertase Pin-like site-specific DNA recombinase